MRERSDWRGMLIALSLIALALRLLIPAGFMPGTSLSVPIVVCTGQGPMAMSMTIAMDPDHRSQSGKAPSSGGGYSCDFASAAAPTLPSAPLDLPAAPTPAAFSLDVAPRPATAPGRGIAAPPPPSHAPPHIRT